ncbi:MAG: hypothetical protein ACREEP_12130, partial [Dongiaceae bacterium]
GQGRGIPQRKGSVGSGGIDLGDQRKGGADIFRSLPVGRDSFSALGLQGSIGQPDDGPNQRFIDHVIGPDRHHRSRPGIEIAGSELGLDPGAPETAAQSLARRQAEEFEIAVADQAKGDAGALGRHKYGLRRSLQADEEYRAPEAASTRKFKHFPANAKA